MRKPKRNSVDSLEIELQCVLLFGIADELNAAAAVQCFQMFQQPLLFAVSDARVTNFNTIVADEAE